MKLRENKGRKKKGTNYMSIIEEYANKYCMTLQKLANSKNYEIRSCNQPLQKDEDFSLAIRPFDFSEMHGGTVDSFKYYNRYYLYPKKPFTANQQKYA